MSCLVDELLAEADRLSGKAERMLEEQETCDTCCEPEDDADLEDILSFGERMVGIEFNPSGLVCVAVTKQDIADVIDDLNRTREDTVNPEVKRLLSIAITNLETACMFAVKGLVGNAK